MTRATVFAMTLLLGSAAAAQAKPAYVFFDPPGSTDTLPAAIGKDHQVAGSFYDQNSKVRGFVRDASGAITVFDPPGSQLTQVTGMNQAGDIVGYYNGADGSAHGFLRKAAGDFVTIDIRKSPTHLSAINDSGTIAGWVTTAKGERGFERFSNGSKSIFKLMKGTTRVIATSLNARQAVVGYYAVHSGQNHGFLLDGAVTAIDVPDALWTMPKEINDGGVVTGTYGDAHGTGVAFSRAPDGTVTSFAAPFPVGGVTGVGTDGQGALYVWYYDNGYHSFAKDTDGKVKRLDVRGAVSTVVTKVGPDGAVIGQYTSANAWHGFLRTR